jgi:hypothetical protein
VCTHHFFNPHCCVLLLLLLLLSSPLCLYRVGDTFVFGQSSRMFVLTGPAELMPQEGLNKQQRKQLQLLEAAQVEEGGGGQGEDAPFTSVFNVCNASGRRGRLLQPCRCLLLA